MAKIFQIWIGDLLKVFAIFWFSINLTANAQSQSIYRASDTQLATNYGISNDSTGMQAVLRSNDDINYTFTLNNCLFTMTRPSYRDPLHEASANFLLNDSNNFFGNLFKDLQIERTFVGLVSASPFINPSAVNTNTLPCDSNSIYTLTIGGGPRLSRNNRLILILSVHTFDNDPARRAQRGGEAWIANGHFVNLRKEGGNFFTQQNIDRMISAGGLALGIYRALAGR